MRARLIGIVLFVIAIAVALYVELVPEDGSDPIITMLFGPQVPQTEVWGFVGGEKMGFLANPEVQEILGERFGITFDARRAGSVEMVSDPVLIGQQPDIYWPSSQVSEELARDNGIVPVKDEIIFNAPIVLFSWLPIAEGLVAEGIARPLSPDQVAFAVDMTALIQMVMERRQWNTIGVDMHAEPMMIFSTDPLKSNSGNQFFGLLVSLLSEGARDGGKLAKALIQVSTIYQRMGYKLSSSGDLFRQYLTTGIGQNPIIAGYESQLIEFAVEDPERWAGIMQRDLRPVILYPEPTVFSSHILLAMNDAGTTLIDALMDPDLQALAWSRHGFRAGAFADNDVSQLPIAGIPEQVTQVVPMPPLSVVTQMIEKLEAAE